MSSWAKVTCDASTELDTKVGQELRFSEYQVLLWIRTWVSLIQCNRSLLSISGCESCGCGLRIVFPFQTSRLMEDEQAGVQGNSYCHSRTAYHSGIMRPPSRKGPWGATLKDCRLARCGDTPLTLAHGRQRQVDLCV